MHTTTQTARQRSRTPQGDVQPAQKAFTVDSAEEPRTTSDSAVVAEWLTRLQEFGFAGATVELIQQLNREQIVTLMDCVTKWEHEHLAALHGNGLRVSPLVSVPKFLRPLDGATSEQFTNTSRLARGARIAGHTAQDNPYSVDTVLHVVWNDAFDNEAFAEPHKSTPSDSLQNDHVPMASAQVQESEREMTRNLSSTFQQPQQEIKMTANSIDQFPRQHVTHHGDRQQQTAEAAQHDMEQALQQQAEFEQRLNDAKSEIRPSADQLVPHPLASICTSSVSGPLVLMIQTP
jgi:hypothetical protein